jgi:predicted aspartyl protease
MFSRTRHLVFVVLLSSVLAGLRAQAPVSDAAAQNARALRMPAATTPFELTSDKPFVEVNVNGKPLSFVLDTGDNVGWVVATSRAEELGISIEDEQTVRMGAGEGVEVAVGNASGLTFAVGDITMTNQAAIVFPLRHVAEFEGRPIDGLIGANFFERYVVRIDYQHRRLAFYDSETFKYWGDGTVVPLEMLTGWPTIRSKIITPDGRSREAHLMVDTGVRMAVVFTRPYVEASELDESLPDLISAEVGGGIGGETQGRIGRLETMTLGDVELRATADTPNFQRFQVRSVVEGSPAADAGLQRGDRIVAVDGGHAGDITLERLRVILRDPGRVCRLKIDREGRLFEVELKLRPLL